MKLRKWYLGTIVHCEGHEVMRFSEGMARRILLTRVSKLHRAWLVSIPTAKYPEGRYAKGAFRRRRNRTFVFSLNERRIMLPPFLHPPFPWERKRDGRARAAIIFGRGRVERSYHSHICKPTGRTVWKLQARDALSLVLSVRHGPRGDGKITGTKLAWPPSRGTLSRDPGIGTGARARDVKCMPRAWPIHYLKARFTFRWERFREVPWLASVTYYYLVCSSDLTECLEKDRSCRIHDSRDL